MTYYTSEYVHTKFPGTYYFTKIDPLYQPQKYSCLASFAMHTAIFFIAIYKADMKKYFSVWGLDIRAILSEIN